MKKKKQWSQRKRPKNWVPLKFYKWIHVFGRKVSEKMKDANEKGMESCDWVEAKICTEEKKDIFIVKWEERRSLKNNWERGTSYPQNHLK